MSLQANSPELNLSASDLAEILRAILNKGSSARFKAKGFSMSPLVRNGDIITVSPFAPATLRSGDIAAFTVEASGRLVVHRIVGIQAESFLMKGDNLAYFDGLIPGSQVLGQITRIERDGCDVRIGLGAERKVIALLSRFHFLPFLVVPARRLFRRWKKTP
jgi:signal peptidase I